MPTPPRHGPREPDPADAARTDLTLPELLGQAGTQEDERNNVVWVAGLLAVLVFLALIAVVVSRLSPA